MDRATETFATLRVKNATDMAAAFRVTITQVAPERGR
jgi:hypothetical protein